MKGRRGRSRAGRDVCGILLLDKPPGLTSNAALQEAKRAFKARKAGHTGSLDPLASGMLPLCFGQGTKVCAYLLESDKAYEVTACFGAQTAEHVITRKTHGSALDTGNIAGRNLDQLGIEAVRFTPAQVHAQQHFDPVLCLGTAGAGLYIQEGIAGIHFTGEHTPEFKCFNLLLQFGQVSLNGFDAVLVVFLDSHVEQFGGIIEPGLQLFQHQHDFFQADSFLSQLLRLLRIIPHIRLFEFADYFLELFLACCKVKDTP